MIDWLLATAKTTLQADYTHIWYIDVAKHLSEIAKLYQLLTPEEQTRANKFKFDKDRQQCIIARAYLRIILSHYVAIPATKFRFTAAQQGKLYLENFPDLQFNVTHSNNIILYAVTYQESIGIDVEDETRVVEYYDLAKRFFAAHEAKALQTLTEDVLRQAFYKIWTKKEAFIKAVGEGLSFPLQDFEVNYLAAIKETVKIYKNENIAAANWIIENFQPIVNYQAAICRKNSLNKIFFYQY